MCPIDWVFLQSRLLSLFQSLQVVVYFCTLLVPTATAQIPIACTQRHAFLHCFVSSLKKQNPLRKNLFLGLCDRVMQNFWRKSYLVPITDQEFIFSNFVRLKKWQQMFYKTPNFVKIALENQKLQIFSPVQNLSTTVQKFSKRRTNVVMDWWTSYEHLGPKLQVVILEHLYQCTRV